jgi:mRNA-degrading endonuclease RelE of RelBE toxin-antitoxin system
LSRGYQVSLSRTAEKYFARCDASTRDRLRQKLEKLRVDPFDPQNSKPLKGPTAPFGRDPL